MDACRGTLPLQGSLPGPPLCGYQEAGDRKMEAVQALPSLEKLSLWWRQTQAENQLLQTESGKCGKGVMLKYYVCTWDT